MYLYISVRTFGCVVFRYLRVCFFFFFKCYFWSVHCDIITEVIDYIYTPHLLLFIHTSMDINVISVCTSTSRSFDRAAMARRTSSRLATGWDSCAKYLFICMLVSIIFFLYSFFRCWHNSFCQALVSILKDFFNGSMYKRYKLVRNLPLSPLMYTVLKLFLVV